MSVDSFYFCADLNQADIWWKKPIDNTINDLSHWHPFNDHEHFWFFDTKFIQDDYIPSLRDIQDKYGYDSLSEIYRFIVDRYLDFLERKKKSTLLRLYYLMSYKAERKSQYELVYIGSFHSIIVRCAWKGPINEIANTRITDYFFSEFLQRFMSEEEASAYNGSLIPNLKGLCKPPEMDALDQKTIDSLTLSMDMPCLINAKAWQERWDRLERITELWEELKAEQISEAAIRHLRAIRHIARYAVENDLSMLKVFV